MFATRALRLGSLLTLALAASFGMSTTVLAQATKTETKAKAKAKEVAKEAAKEPIDLNSASAEDLQTLPGIGEALARKIIDGRPHKALADLAGAGVPASTIDKLKPLAEVKPLPAPVDVNADPIEKLEALPGISAALAKEIVAARPIAGYEGIAELKGIGPKKLDALRGRLKFGESAPVAKAKAKAKAKEATAKGEMAKAKVEEAKAVKAETKAAKAETKAEEAKAEAKVAKTKEAPATKPAPGAKVNINKAGKEELDSLFGIGEVRAQAIIDARPFATIEDIMKVKGIKEFEFNKIKDRITVK